MQPPASPTRLHRFTLLAFTTSILAGATACPGDPPVEPGPDAPPIDAPIDTAPATWTGLTPAGGAMPPFGGAIAFDGDTLIVGGGYGADADDPAYIYQRRADGTWAEQARLTAEPGARSFGRRVAISGDTALVDATAGTAEAPETRVHVYQRQGDAWTLATTLDAASPFGGLAIDGDTIVVGALGLSARVYLRDAGTWDELVTLEAPVLEHGVTFASAVALDGDTLVIGDPYGRSEAEETATGVAHVFVRHGARWTLETTLVPTFVDVTPQRIGFGASVAVRGDRAVVGVRADAPCSYALIYDRSGESWTRSARIDSGHNVCGDIAGLSVALGDDVVALGATGYGGDFPSSGAVYVHRLVGGTWTARSPSPLPVRSTEAGGAIALGDSLVLIGAPDHGTVFEHPLLP